MPIAVRMQELLAISFLLAALSQGLAIPSKDKLQRTIDRPPSQEEHFRDGQHNPNYDHEAFLGQEASKTFDQLTPEESKSKLSAIVDKIDTDGDGFVTDKELQLWIHKAQRSYIMDDVDRQWKSHNPDGLPKLTWDQYKSLTYGFLGETDTNSIDKDTKTYAEMMRRDLRRWQEADQDKDQALTKDEFADFLHPEETEHMRGVVVEETLEDIDKNKDGLISMDEYISDMYSPDATGDHAVPEWVTREREQFSTYRDKNGDGFMDKAEIREWIVPQDYDHSEAEAKHLIYESDKDKDGKLTKHEILDNYDLFVGSQVTDFGEALMTAHDEF